MTYSKRFGVFVDNDPHMLAAPRPIRSYDTLREALDCADDYTTDYQTKVLVAVKKGENVWIVLETHVKDWKTGEMVAF